MSNPTQELFDDWARRGRDSGMEEGHFPRAEQALEMMPVLPGHKVLDLGCGNGWATRWLRQCTGPRGLAMGIDIAPEMIDKACCLSGAAKALDFKVAAFEALPFADASYDHAFSMEALYYAPDLSIALLEIARVLKPQGTLCFCTDFYQENPHCHDWPAAMNIPMQLLSEKGWCQRFEGAGFKVLETMRCLDSRPVDPELGGGGTSCYRGFSPRAGIFGHLGGASGRSLNSGPRSAFRHQTVSF